jgi:hypothetical protein
MFIAWHYVRHLAVLVRGHDFMRAAPLEAAEARRREVLALCYLRMSPYSLLLGDEEGFALGFAGVNAALPLGRHEVLSKLLQNVALAHHLLGRFWASERVIREAQRMAESDVDRALLLSMELLARQAVQRPIHRGQAPVYEHEAAMIQAVDLLSTRSQALYAHVARSVAASTVFHYARRFRFRPEVLRWADAMGGTVHHGYVRGVAAIMARIDGQKKRSELAYARAQEGRTTPVYRGWVDAHLAYVCAVTGDTAQAIRCMRSLAPTVATLPMRNALALWIPAMAIAAIIVLLARGREDAFLTPCLEEHVARLDAVIHRLGGNVRLIHEAGRIALGRGTLGALNRAKQRSLEVWASEQNITGHLDGCLLAALALRMSARSDCAAAAPGWAREALSLIEPRFPESYVAQVRDLLGLSSSSG